MKKCVVIYNPNSGKAVKHDFTEEFTNILKEYNYDVNFIKTEYKGQAKEIVTNLEIVDLVISIGGDGTFNESMTGNLRRKERLVLAHIPMGTANDIGAMFGYEKNIFKNLKLLLNGVVKDIDICTINNQPFVYVAGFGKFVNISYETPRHLKKKYGYLAYLIEGIKEGIEDIPIYDINYYIDGEKHSDKVSFMLISNANRIAGINNFYKDVKLDDNCFEVLFCKISKKKDILKNLYYLTKYDITKLPGFKFYKINNLKIEFNTPPEKGWSIDGEELVTDKNIFEIKMVRNVKILLPKKNVGKLFLEEME